MSEPVITNDPAVMRLAHPLRCPAVELHIVDMFKEVLGPVTWANMEKAFRQEGRLTGDIVGELQSHPENHKLKYMVQATSRMGGGTEVGNSYAILIYLRHVISPQPYFVIDDSLVELLEHTDIADDVPISTMALPYKRFFVEFGKSRTCKLVLPNIETGDHVLEGCYVEQGSHHDHGPGIFVLFTGSPLGKENAMDDATHSLFLPMSQPDMPVREVLERMHKSGTELSLEAGLRPTPAEFVNPTFENLMFLTKVLLYISLPEARKEIHKDRSDWLKSVSNLKSTAKKAKAEKRGRGLVDHILVCAPPPRVEDAASGESTGRTVKSHWRRGHYRMQPYGPQNALRKLKFLQPMLIHGTSAEAPPPQYRVT